MHDHTLHRGGKHFCCYRLQDFSKEEILRGYIKNGFKINGKQRIIMLKKVNLSPFKSYEDFERILVTENNGMQDPGDPGLIQ